MNITFFGGEIMNKVREIDITKEDVRCYDGICVEDNVISITYELWFDVDKYFGTDTRDKDDTWINFYTYWKPNGHVSAEYYLDSDDDCKVFDWSLTENEKEFFLHKMEAYCKEKTGKTLSELWESC
jgi:hypothetical protein